MSKPRYLFHNIYGDAKELIETKPDDVICVPFGWDPVTEEKRNTLLQELGVYVSCLPCLVYWKEEHTITHADGFQSVQPTGWYEFRFDQDKKPWSWDQLPQ
jgi:hypothetical protein